MVCAQLAEQEVAVASRDAHHWRGYPSRERLTVFSVHFCHTEEWTRATTLAGSSE